MSLSLLFFIGMLPTVAAQWVVVPVGSSVSTSPQKAARTQALTLPFFDDFSLSTNGHPDPTLWQNGGTYVNNTLTIGQPTLNVVTFDGADATGRPYNLTSPFAQGYGDTLTSQPIDLSSIKDTSTYLSFYAQLRGLGELPDSTDFLHLYFLNQQGEWKNVWKKEGGKPNNNFNYTKLALQAEYLHSNFQFRFISYGRLSGQFDMWHLDYVYLNNNRQLPDQFIKDVAYRLPVNSFLKRYTAMPIKQYLARSIAETTDSLKSDLNNLFNSFNPITVSYTVRDIANNRLYIDFTQSPENISSLSQRPVIFKPTPISFSDTLKRVVLKTQFKVLTTDNQNSSIPGIDLRRNDSISSITELSDYYAYDDGSAESAVYFNRSLGRTAVRFTVNTPDNLSGVRMNIVPIVKDVSGQSITIQVWSSESGRPKSILYQKAYKVSYPAHFNEFIEFPFDYGVAVRDTFYVGWLQIGQDGIPVGLDRNNANEDKIFINSGQEWVPYTSFKNDASLAYFQGSLMLRPVLGTVKSSDPLTSVEPTEEAEWEVYPNPTRGSVSWNSGDVKYIEVYQLNGTRLRSQPVQPAERSIDLTPLGDGIYFLRLSNEKKTVVKKILLSK
ncbi:T9SS type A sorting domain-containing protein [Runella sp. SP2]|uniref:T9SS type A sorting domain-containing protein n=1 Tax=Runella sp. SP2 TaxID=2268026 RepID=UPI0013DE538A|nr:T9SS type A sorting domain-containing protein [Runella sp. SP2]